MKINELKLISGIIQNLEKMWRTAGKIKRVVEEDEEKEKEELKDKEEYANRTLAQIKWHFILWGGREGKEIKGEKLSCRSILGSLMGRWNKWMKIKIGEKKGTMKRGERKEKKEKDKLKKNKNGEIEEEPEVSSRPSKLAAWNKDMDEERVHGEWVEEEYNEKMGMGDMEEERVFSGNE